MAYHFIMIYNLLNSSIGLYSAKHNTYKCVFQMYFTNAIHRKEDIRYHLYLTKLILSVSVKCMWLL